MVQKIALFDPLRPALLVARGVARNPLFGRKRRFVALRLVAPHGPLDSPRVPDPRLDAKHAYGNAAWVHRAAR